MRFLKAFLLVYISWLLLGVLNNVSFLIVHHDIIDGCNLTDCLQVIGHGMSLNMSVASYLTILPSLMLLCTIWIRKPLMLHSWRFMMAVLSFIVALACLSNIMLYKYWGFPLDATPILYLRTSPSGAMASLTGIELILSLIAFIFTWFAIFLFTDYIVNPSKLIKAKKRSSIKSRIAESLLLLLFTALLILPLRGGVGAGTIHTGSVYFSSNMRLNHAAVNPIFSFVESMLHKVDISSQFRFMTDDRATELFDGMIYTQLRNNSENDSLKLKANSQTNVIIIMLEGFSKYIMAEGGHVSGVTPRLESYATNGLYFDHFYANSVRTDRAIVSILSGIPSQPSMSIMDMPRKSTQLPSIARTLGHKGYSTRFYYGGDTNYSNMQSYIVGTGYQAVVSDKSFPSSLITSKWGVHDGFVFDRILKDIDEMDKSRPFLITMMTLSSHEPFDVPYKSGLSDEALNAFAYTDNELGRFIDTLQTMPLWQNTLVVLVPDHLGAYPADIDNYQQWRYEIPLIMTGGVIKQPAKISTIGSQNDIAATLLGILEIDHSEFTYSKDLLDKQSPHFALFAFPDAAFGMITDDNQVLYDGVPDKVIWDNGLNPGQNISKAKAYIQKLYDYIDSL